MIAAGLALLGGSPARAWLLAGAVAAVLAGLAWVDHRAYRSGEAACAARTAAEVERQREAAQRAQYGAARRVAEIDARRRAAEDRERTLADATRNLDAACLPADVVRAIRAAGGQP